MPDGKFNRQIESEAHKKFDLCVVSLLRKIETEGAALMLWGRKIDISGAAQRKARDPFS